jgi:hypothetical protein
VRWGESGAPRPNHPAAQNASPRHDDSPADRGALLLGANLPRRGVGLQGRWAVRIGIVTGQPTQCLSADEITALKFAAHRQLTRWAAKGRLSPHQNAQRPALVRAVRILEDQAFTQGCELHIPSENVDG